MSLRSYILLFVVPIPQVRPGSHQHFRAFPGPPPVLRSSSEKWKFRNPFLGPFRASSRDLPSGRCLREAEVGYLPGTLLIFQFAIWVFCCRSFPLGKYIPNFQIFKYHVEIFEYSDFQILLYSNTRISRYSNIRIFKYCDIQIFKYSNIQIFTCAFKYSNM